MAKIWFKRRRRGLGVGYGPASIEGLIALFVVIGVAVFGLRWVPPWAAQHGIDPRHAGAVATLVLMGGLFWLIKLKSED